MCTYFPLLVTVHPFLPSNELGFGSDRLCELGWRHHNLLRFQFHAQCVVTVAVFAEMAQECYRKDSSVLERLHELYARYGVFHSIGGYVISNSTEVMERVFSDIRGSEEPSYPDTIAGKLPHSATL